MIIIELNSWLDWAGNFLLSLAIYLFVAIHCKCLDCPKLKASFMSIDTSPSQVAKCSLSSSTGIRVADSSYELWVW